MRLVKICNVLVNLDNVAMIRSMYNHEKPRVYAYTSGGEELFLGQCENMEDYKEFIDMLYDIAGESWPGETADEGIIDDEDKELWG